MPPISSFSIGEYGLWSAEVRWYRDEERYSDYRKVIVEINDPMQSRVNEDTSLPHKAPLLEGNVSSVELTTYERHPEARRLCLEYSGSVCHACGFDFEKTYGPIGKSLIHVHHIIPLSAIRMEYEVNPIIDLVPVCPNCHAIMHRRQPPYSLEEVKVMLGSCHEKNRGGSAGRLG